MPLTLRRRAPPDRFKAPDPYDGILTRQRLHRNIRTPGARETAQSCNASAGVVLDPAHLRAITFGYVVAV